MRDKISLFWFRRDLRLQDNVGFHHALKSGNSVLPIFIFDKNILNHLPKNDARVSFIYQKLSELHLQLVRDYGSGIKVFYTTPRLALESLSKDYHIQALYTNHDYEPYALQRDTEIEQWCLTNAIEFKTYKDQVIFEKSEVVKDDGVPYVVYTPYKNKWKSLFSTSSHAQEYEPELSNLYKHVSNDFIALEEMGFEPSSIQVPDPKIQDLLIANYESTRNFPALENGTSRLGPHLRFGTVSIRHMVRRALRADNETFLSELIWREFFMQILWHYPHTRNQSFKPKYDRIEWRNDEEEFEKWKNGKTGYVLVDAGMRELNQTGYMHNRVRMLVASFLCKHLLIDWRWGEAYFAEKLLDYEMASNVGNWQWAAGSGVDAAPYFRIFNPLTQVSKFDNKGIYINKWVPEYKGLNYPNMMVDHKTARERCLATYKAAVS